MFRSGFPGLILPDRLRFGNAGILQNPVHIIGENRRYIEPFLAESERGCQGAGSHKALLCVAKLNCKLVSDRREGDLGYASTSRLFTKYFAFQ